MSEFVYTKFAINSTPQKVWDAITVPEFARQYWGHANVSDWKLGSKWEHVKPDGSILMTGEVLKCPARPAGDELDASGRFADKPEHSVTL